MRSKMAADGSTTVDGLTCSKLVSRQTEGLHLHLEGVDGHILGHGQRLLLTAQVGVSQGSPQVVQAAVLDRDGLWPRADLNTEERKQCPTLHTLKHFASNCWV